LRTFERVNCAAMQGRYRWRGAGGSGSRIGRLAACGTRVAQESAEQAEQAGGLHLLRRLPLLHCKPRYDRL
jgi:hypothetical protein